MNIGSPVTPVTYTSQYPAAVGPQHTDSPRQPDKHPADNPRNSYATAGLSEAELRELDRLQARDAEVKAHEAAHQGVGGAHAGAASFTYRRGPDGVQYAVGGEVPIDMAPVEGNPQATIEKMRVVHAAALAPAQPSSQDRSVAAAAMQRLLQAQVELARKDTDAAMNAGEKDEPRDRSAVESYRSVAQASESGASAIGTTFQATA